MILMIDQQVSQCMDNQINVNIFHTFYLLDWTVIIFVLLFSQVYDDNCSNSFHYILTQIQLMSIPKNWLGDRYQGQYKQGWFHGYGKLQMDSGVIYEGQFVKGHFHGQGKLLYPNGGYYKAQWQEGKMTSGEYFFKDNLRYEEPQKWKHCIGQDRRFYEQYLNGIKPSGATQQTRDEKPHMIPPGTYDSGDGYYEPVKSIIYGYDGQIKRTPTESEVKFIMQKCRYVPKLVNIDGERDKIIKKVVVNTQNN